MKISVVIIFCFTYFLGTSQIIFEESHSFSKPIWQKVTDGECSSLGLNYDYGNDGTIEYLYSIYHKTLQVPAGFGFGWEMRKYNPSNQEYEVTFTSNILEEWNIQEMAIADLGNDGNDELLLGGKRNLHIYSLSNLEYIACIELDKLFYDIWTIQYADVDNDSKNELVISGQHQLTVFDGATLELKMHIDEIEAAEFRIGNVDGDSENELVFANGGVYNITSDGLYNVKYLIIPLDNNAHNNSIELMDIDSDGKNEVILIYDKYLRAYNADSGSLIYEYFIDENIGTKKLKLADIDDDGINEIYYSFDSFGSNLHIHDARTGDLLLRHETVNGNPRAIRMADYDMDGQVEMFVSDNCNSTAAQRFIVHDANTNILEFDSAPRYSSRYLNYYGSLYNLCIEDFNGDGSLEIATMAHDGVLNVYDIASEKLLHKRSEHQSGHLEVRSLEAYDYDKDGTQDMITADGNRLVFINGSDYQFDFFKTFSQLPGHGFRNMEIIDLDKDGRSELLTSAARITPFNSLKDTFYSKIRVIDIDTHEELWSAEVTGDLLPTSVFGANLDGDLNEEIVVCSGNIFVVDYPSSNTSITDHNMYSCAASYNANIVAGTTYGSIHILSGDNLLPIDSLVITNEIIDNVRYLDYDNDGISELFVIANNTLFRIKNLEEVDSINVYGTANGRFDAFDFTDIDNDNIYELFLGGGYRFQQVDLSAFDCNAFETTVIVENPDCSDTSWHVSISANEEITKVLFNSFIAEKEIGPLRSGNYSVFVENAVGCRDIYHIELKNDLLQQVQTIPYAISCGIIGSAQPIITGGNEPYSYLWSNGDTTEIISTEETGIYYVTITDATNCVIKDSVIIGELEGEMSLFARSETCRNESVVVVGLVGNHFLAGEYYYNGILGTNPMQGLPPGNYELEVIDINGCMFFDVFELMEPELDLSVDFVNTCEGDSSGYIIINASNGQTPYSYDWSDPELIGRELDNLIAGTYSVTVSDRNDCSNTAEIIIENKMLTTFYLDQDQDGFGDDQMPSLLSCYELLGYADNNDDCDDNNQNINPDQGEIPYNGKDDDCNSATLDDDLDQDGFMLADDCDDDNPNINPDQTEEPYNGIDDDCNHATLDDDLDQDGFLLADDCDDNNQNINPDAEEIPNNGTDEDCDGMDLVSSVHELSNSTIKIYPIPSIDIINIAIEGQLDYQVDLYDLEGKRIKSTHNSNQIKIETFPQGTYLLQIKDLKTGQKIVERLVIGR